MSPGAPFDEFSRQELIALIQELLRQNSELRVEIERLKRSQRRQAAPFSKNQPKAHPKKPVASLVKECSPIDPRQTGLPPKR